MGSSWILRVSDHAIFDAKSNLDPQLMILFHPKDHHQQQLKYKDTPYSYWDCEYRVMAAAMIDRLEIRGWTLEGAKAAFKTSLDRIVQVNQELFEEHIWAHTKENADYLAFLRNYSFEDWLSAMKSLLRLKGRSIFFPARKSRNPVKRLIQKYTNDDFYLGFPNVDPRLLLRAVLEAAKPSDPVALDYSELVNNGYVELSPAYDEWATETVAHEYVRASKIIILTEGSFDSMVLRETLPLLYPHLECLFAFMDFDAPNAPGGASTLVNHVKAFIGSGIRNRIVALFDNDTGAHDALRGLKGVAVPSNLSIIHLPRLKLAERYPTEGPNGPARIDINGLAVTTEMFLGIDVLRNGGRISKVQWTGFVQGLRRYQGELTEKRAVQQRFLEKLAAAKRKPEITKSKDWNDLRSLWTSIFTTVARDFGHK